MSAPDVPCEKFSWCSGHSAQGQPNGWADAHTGTLAEIDDGSGNLVHLTVFVDEEPSDEPVLFELDLGEWSVAPERVSFEFAQIRRVIDEAERRVTEAVAQMHGTAIA